MSVNAGNIDVIIDTSGFDVPACAHGPTLLFSKYDQSSGSPRQFFACSAFRDRKACSFFRWTDIAHGSQLGQDRRCVRVPELWPTLCHKEMKKRFAKFKKQKELQRCMCIDCGLLLLPGEIECHQGEGHKLKSQVTNEMLEKPSELFQAFEDNKTFAQYLFSPSTVEFVLNTLQNLRVTHVLAVGCPRIHEAIELKTKGQSQPALHSLLLDLDHRYLQVNAPGKFCRYNMLNHHFFGGSDDVGIFSHFLREEHGKRVAMVVDPPFGIMVEALCATVQKIQEEWKSYRTADSGSMPVLWFFPYFMEQRVIETNNTFSMLDYKVDYDNHALFTQSKGRKKGSPVRIFTNLPARQIVLPKQEGYWFCKKCDRYSSGENKHCNLCQSCTTKDGRTYRHCEKCARCVKPSRVHCDLCNVCDLQTHTCSVAKTTGCHICGEVGHKRRECPVKDAQNQTPAASKSRKRQSDQKPAVSSKGKKKKSAKH